MVHSIRSLSGEPWRDVARTAANGAGLSESARGDRPMGAVTRGDDARRAWPAPAKLNLFLHILGRRPDGYHELQTAFQFIDLCDELSFEPRADGRIVRTAGPAEVPEAEDLVVRAAYRLRETTGVR